MTPLAYELIHDDKVIIKFSNGKIKVLKVYHESVDSILCDDFETYFMKKEVKYGL